MAAVAPGNEALDVSLFSTSAEPGGPSLVGM